MVGAGLKNIWICCCLSAVDKKESATFHHFTLQNCEHKLAGHMVCGRVTTSSISKMETSDMWPFLCSSLDCMIYQKQFYPLNGNSTNFKIFTEEERVPMKKVMHTEYIPVSISVALMQGKTWHLFYSKGHLNTCFLFLLQ